VTTIRDLAAFAATGNVVAAQAFLGDSAPDLRPSGLKGATFPEVTAAQVAISRGATGFVALVGSDRLTSLDGTTWAFDYADRPLAVYGRSAERDLYWVEPDGRHDLFLHVTSATITPSSLQVRLAWKFRPNRPKDPYYRDATISITSITLGSRNLPLPIKPSATIDPAVRSAVLNVAGPIEVPPQILVQVTITPRAGAGGSTTVRTISTVFEVRLA
jgi:hypothetical protein